MISTSPSIPISGDGPASLQREADAYADVLRVCAGDQLGALFRGERLRAVGSALYRAPPYELSVPALTVARLSVNLTPARVCAAVAGGRLCSFNAGRYALFMTPADTPMHFRKDMPSRHINIYFRPGLFGDGDSEGDDARSPLAASQPRYNLVVPGIRGLADQLAAEIQSPVMHNADAADSLARLLLVMLSRHLRRAPAPSRALTPETLARLRDYVMANLGERILVADLARQAGLSADSFAVAYKAQTGQAPHQFVLATRLGHAADLLRHSAWGLADIAHACGFASQQHLTNVMRQRMGVTPARFRDRDRDR